MKANIISDTEVLHFFRFHLHPMLVQMYVEAKLEVPELFDHKTEGPRLIAAFRAQGFDLHFIDKAGREIT